MNATPLLKQSDEQILEIARQLRTAYKLKSTLRYGTKRDVTAHSESVAEHVFALFFLAEYFAGVEDLERSLDMAKLNRILLFHDFPEIKHGDIPYHQKTREHEERENLAAKEIFASLPTSLEKLGYDSWSDYEERGSIEARFAYALDKIEPLFELSDPINELSMKRSKFTYKDNIERKLKATESFPVMRRFAVVMSEDMLRRNVFWSEKSL